jgi:hypothetical protein
MAWRSAARKLAGEAIYGAGLRLAGRERASSGASAAPWPPAVGRWRTKGARSSEISDPPRSWIMEAGSWRDPGCHDP